MNELKEDEFITKLIGFKSYIIHKKILSKSFKNLKKLTFYAFVKKNNFLI